MIRWKYVVPRLLLVVVVLLFAAFGIDPLLRWSIVHFGQQAVGAAVELEFARVSIADTQLKLAGLQVANPKSPLENLFQADTLLLDLDANALMRKRFVIDHARVQGLEIRAARDSSGRLETEIGPLDSDSEGIDLSQLGRQWLENVGDAAEAKLRNDLKSIPLAEGLHVRWTDKYQMMKVKVELIEQRIRTLRDLYKSTDRKDPLKIAAAIQKAESEARLLNNEMLLLRNEIERIQHDVRLDVAAIEEAKQHDLEYLRGAVRLDQFKPARLAEYLLEEDMRGQLSSVVTWVGRCRRLLKATSEPTPPRIQGIDVLFSQRQQRPSFLVRHLAADGFAEIDGRRVPFVAEAHSLSSHPRLAGEPTRIRLSTQGEVAAVVDAVLDYTGDEPRQTYTVDVPHLAMPDRHWGDPDKFSLAVAKSHARVWCRFEAGSGRLKGRIIFVQDDVRLRPMSESLGPRLESQLAAAMSQVTKLHAVVDVEGAIARPNWTIQSNLGPQVAVALNETMNAEVEFRKQQVAGKLNEALQREVEKLNTLVEQRKQELLGKLDLNTKQIGDIQSMVAEMSGLSSLRLPGGMTIQGLFRR